MSQPPLPTSYDVQVYPLGQSGALGSDQWLEWGIANPGYTPLTVSFQSGLAVKSIWFPNPQGAMQFYAGDSATGTPFYETDGIVAELVPIPNDAPVVTIAGPATPFFFYASSYGFSPFSAGTPPVVDVTCIAPIVNEGTPEVPIIALQTPLAVMYGGSGSADPSLIAGANVTITGAWPNQQIDVSEGAGGVQSVSVNAPIVETGTSQNPVIGLITPLPVDDGGTGCPNVSGGPWLRGVTGIDVNGASGVKDDSFQWDLVNTGVLEIETPDSMTQAGNVHFTSADSSLTITGDGANHVDFSVDFPNAKAFLAKISNPAPSGSSSGSATLSLGPLPGGGSATWLLEAWVGGLSAAEGMDDTVTATLELSTGATVGWDETQYTRALIVGDTIAGGTTPTATFNWADGVSVNSHASAAFFCFKATRTA